MSQEWEDEAYVLSARSHGETGAIVELLTESRGKFAAHVAGAASRRMKPFLQPGARVIDLDIILWSGGIHASRSLAVPHPAFRERSFVLGPLAQLAPDWRDPVTQLTVRQLAARLTRRAPLPRRSPA